MTRIHTTLPPDNSKYASGSGSLSTPTNRFKLCLKRLPNCELNWFLTDSGRVSSSSKKLMILAPIIFPSLVSLSLSRRTGSCKTFSTDSIVTRQKRPMCATANNKLSLMRKSPKSFIFAPRYLQASWQLAALQDEFSGNVDLETKAGFFHLDQIDAKRFLKINFPLKSLFNHSHSTFIKYRSFAWRKLSGGKDFPPPFRHNY